MRIVEITHILILAHTPIYREALPTYPPSPTYMYITYNNKASESKAEMQFKAQLKLNRAFHSKWVSLKGG